MRFGSSHSLFRTHRSIIVVLNFVIVLDIVVLIVIVIVAITSFD